MVKRSVLLFLAALMVAGFQASAVSINTNGQNGVIRTQSAKTMGKLKLNIGTGINIYQSNSYVGDVFTPLDTPITFDQPNREAARMLSTNLFGAFGMTRFWDLAVALPLYYDWLGFDNKQSGGIGDLEISSKFLIPPFGKRLFYQSYLVGVTVPTGMKSSGFFPRHPYYIEGNDTNPATTGFYTAKYPTVKGLMNVTFDIKNVANKVPLLFHINIGGVITSSMRHQRNTAIGSFAVEYTPAEIISLFVDLHGESRWSNFSTTLDPSSDPMLVSPGIRLNTASGLYLNLVGDFSLSSRAKSARLNWNPDIGPAAKYKYSTGVYPGYGIQFVLGWNGFVVNPDDDKDGIPNIDDKCPKEKEDVDGWQDDDGCPDGDNDADGVADAKDKCPTDPEDKDGHKDDDGCPDLDNDGDGIPDLRDQCPGKAEDFDGFEDHDGCPDQDNDKDNVPDSVDKCPNDPEDADAYQDNDGCPDVDNDQDGVPDLKDRCPDVPGTPMNNGCKPVDTVKPPVRKEPDFPKTQTLYGVEFRKGTAELTFGSYQFLEPLVTKLRANPELEIEVHGHTDAMGNYTRNMQLSQMRAEAVRQYLIAKGVPSDKVRSVGFGSSSPIADNKTASGRAQNRRIQVIRVK